MNWSQVNKLLAPFDMQISMSGFLDHKDGTVLGHYLTNTMITKNTRVEDVEISCIVLGTTNPTHIKPIKAICLLGGITLKE